MINSKPEVSGAQIYAMNHSCMHDIPIAGEAIQEHFTVLVGRQPLELQDRLFFWLNGVIYIDRKNKPSKRNGVRKMLETLKKGNNILIFPEGTWNLTPSKPMLPLYWGVIDLARISGVPIIPLIAEYSIGYCQVKFGKPIYVSSNIEKKDGIEQLEDIMATLKWEIWEDSPIQKRQADMEENFEKIIEERIFEYPKLDLVYESSVIRGRENEPQYVFSSK